MVTETQKHYIVDTLVYVQRMNLWTYDGYRDTKHYIVDTAMITRSRLSSIYWSNTYKG